MEDDDFGEGQVTQLTSEGVPVPIPMESDGRVFPASQGDTGEYDLVTWQEGFSAGYAQGAQDVVGHVLRVLRSLGLISSEPPQI